MKRFIVMLPDNIVKQLDKAAKQDNRSRNNLITLIISTFLKHYNEKFKVE
jgi:metal-responsive CopG/Arc/MetJ family transcriptional regulator